MIIHYTMQRDLVRRDGVTFENPKYFRSANPNATEVVVVGRWPSIVEAYTRLGIKVTTDMSAIDDVVRDLDVPTLATDTESPTLDAKDVLIAELANHGIKKDRRSSEDVLRKILEDVKANRNY